MNGTGPATEWMTAETFESDLDGKDARFAQLPARSGPCLTAERVKAISAYGLD